MKLVSCCPPSSGAKKQEGSPILPLLCRSLILHHRFTERGGNLRSCASFLPSSFPEGFHLSYIRFPSPQKKNFFRGTMEGIVRPGHPGRPHDKEKGRARLRSWPMISFHLPHASSEHLPSSKMALAKYPSHPIRLRDDTSFWRGRGKEW